ncbi:Cytochrome [Abeliophyllum distichum]|uniref:Cytochrome n=1 Tax=Abeliophyllum distichum TaxID=126358 RepID=A0ABD1TWA1_9LAMI
MAEDHFFMLSFLVLPFLYLIFKSFKSYNPPLPPGPFPWPVLGNLYYIKTMDYVSLATLATKHGPLMLLREGMQYLVIGSSSVAATEILKMKDRVFSARTVPSSVPLTRSEIDQLSFWADALSDNFKNLRAMCRAELFSSKALESQAHLREKKIMEMVEFLKGKDGLVVNIEKCVYAAVFNMFSNAFFSRDFIRLENESSDNPVKDILRGIIGALITPNLSDAYPFLSKLDLQGLRKKHREMSVRIHALWEPIVKERRKRPRGNLSNQDFLDALLDNGFTDYQINKLLEELVTAGIDTTTSTINRTMVELVNNPESMKKLQEELDTEFNQDFVRTSNLVQLPYLRACVKETLRLHPPAPLLLSHRALETCQVMNYTVPKNARVLVNVWAIGRDPSTWDGPSEYRPNRFLDSALDFKGNDFEFLPFGAGRRICPGLPMATKIVPAIIASLVYFLDWSLPHGNDPAIYEKLRATSKMIEPLLLIPKFRK